MYEYRKLSEADQRRAIAARRSRQLPLHAPPHYPDGRQAYIITAACFEHRPFIEPAPRRDLLWQELQKLPGDIHA